MTRPVTLFERCYTPKGDMANSPYEYREVGKARFHQFSTESVIHDKGPENFCVAVVEFPDGTVKTWHADNIRFDDVGVVG